MITKPRIAVQPPITVILLLLGFLLLFFIQRLSLFTPTALTNDNYALEYPLRILFSTSIQNRIFPLWDHWTHGGIPLYTLINMAGLSPIVIFLSLFGMYSTNTYTVEILCVIILGFFGMYLWLSRFASDIPSLVIATCFSVSALQVAQTQLNFDAVASTFMLPWLAFGIHSALKGFRYGIGIIALSVWIASTEGYLGYNLIAWQFILVFCVSEWAVRNRHNLLKKEILTKPLSVVTGFVLGFLIISFPVLETISHFGLSFDKIREIGFNAYAASANVFTAFTLVFPNKIWMFWSDPKYLSGTGILYFGFFQLLFILYALLKEKRKSRVWMLLFFAAISFCTTLSAKYVPAVFLNTVIPFLDKIRWHGWFLTVTVFFLATASCIGLQYFIEDKHNVKKWIAVFVFTGICIFAAIKQSGSLYVSPLSYLSYPQVYVFVVFLAILLISIKIPRAMNAIVGLLIIEIYLTSNTIPLLGNNLFYRGLNLPEIRIREKAKTDTESFPPVTNIRSSDDSHVNTQYYTKQPSLYGYNPMTYPGIINLMKTEEYPVVMKRLFYVTDGQSIPADSVGLDIKNIRLTPNVVDADMFVTSGKEDVVWSSPYTPYWKLYVDGRSRPTAANTNSLTEFSLTGGNHHVRFIYSPPYLVPSMLISVSAVITSFWLLCIRKRKYDKT